MSHLTEHTQLVENQSRSSLQSHEKLLIDLLSKLKSLTVSPRVSESPFVQLEKWRRDAHQKLDQLAEEKRQEIQQHITDYQKEFLRQTNEQKQKLNSLKKRLIDLTRQTQIASKDLKNLDEKLLETKNFILSTEKHSIKLSICTFSVQIRTNLFDSSAASPRRARPETREPPPRPTKPRVDKKRSLSASLL